MSRIAAAVVVLVVILLLAAGPASAAPPYASPSPVATGPGAQQSADPGSDGWNGLLVWEDNGSGSWHIGAQRDGLPITIPFTAGTQRHPATYPGCAVYEDERNGTWDLYRSVIITPGPTPSDEQDLPFATGPGDQLDPAVFGDTVVYESNVAGNWDIYARSISTGVERRLTTNSASQVDPAISGSKVVWADHRNGNWDIYGFDLDTGQTKRLTTNTAAEQAPQIRNGLVVFQGHRNGNWDIYDYSFTTGKERRLTTDLHDQTAPSTGGARSVVYEDHRKAEPDIYVCDLRTGANRPVTNDATAQSSPRAADDVVVWTDESAGDPDVYSCTLEYPGLFLKAPGSTLAYGTTVHVTGTLVFGSPPPTKTSVSLKVGLTVHKVPVNGFDADSAGSFSYSFQVVRKTRITVKYTDATQLPAVPVGKTVLSTALLTRPVLTMSPRPAGVLISPRAITVSGVLKPRHSAGSTAVTLEVYRKGLLQPWKLIKTVRVKVHDQGAFSAYAFTVLPHAAPGWYYEVKAIHSDADHARTESASSNVVHP